MRTTARAALCLLGLSAAANCGSAESTAPPGGEPVKSTRITQVSRMEAQLQASRLAFGAGRLGRLGADALEVWELASGTRTRLPLHDPKGLGATLDGALVAVDQPAPGQPRLHVLAPGSATPGVYQGFFSVAFGALSRIAGASGGDLWVSTPGPGTSQTLLRLGEAGALSAQGYRSLEADQALCWTGLADGSALSFWSDALLWERPGVEPVRLPLPADARPIRHLAPGPEGQVWASTGDGALVRLKLGATASVAWRVRPEGGMIDHLAAAGDAAAALLVDEPPTGPARWTLVVYGPTAERWRHEIPAPAQPSDTWVAVGQGYVAVGGAGSLSVWRADDGVLAWSAGG